MVRRYLDGFHLDCLLVSGHRSVSENLQSFGLERVDPLHGQGLAVDDNGDDFRAFSNEAGQRVAQGVAAGEIEFDQPVGLFPIQDVIFE